MEIKLFLAIFSLLLMTFPLFWITNEAQKQPYMDEIFHVPQAQQYCAGNFTAWDPMITTLPGLYLLSLPLVWMVWMVVGGRQDTSDVCTTEVLRGVNVVFCVANFYILYLIASRLHFNRQNSGQVVLTALALSTFPVLYFFSFLYYTDPVSTLCALLAYHLTLCGSHRLAAMAGVLAIFCRQTNVMWVAFSAGITLSPVLLRWIQLDKKQGEGKGQGNKKRKEVCDWLVLSKTVALIGQSCRYNPRGLVDLGLDMVKAVWSYVLVGVGFFAFVVVNKGIVVGDRSNHQACLNFPQLFYFLIITASFSFMHMVSVGKVLHFVRYTFKHPVRTLLFLFLAVVFITKFMFIHEYNLADNRHYNFYFLSKIVRRNEYAKYVLVPVYYYAFVTMYHMLQGKDVFWKLSYLLCIAACIVPQRMIEFRYFVVPYLIFRLNMPMPSKWLLMLEVLFYFAINALTVYMYIYWPFMWANAEGLQRFMW